MRQLSSRFGIFIGGVIFGLCLAQLRPVPRSRVVVQAPVAPQTTPVVEAPRAPAAVANEPHLSAPIFKDHGVLRSTLAGYVHVRWHPVATARRYKLEVQDEGGKAVRTFETTHTFSYIKNLDVDPSKPQTEYRVQVTPIDGEGSVGPVSEWKTLAMLPMKDLAPPTIKSITTED